MVNGTGITSPRMEDLAAITSVVVSFATAERIRQVQEVERMNLADRQMTENINMSFMRLFWKYITEGAQDFDPRAGKGRRKMDPLGWRKKLLEKMDSRHFIQLPNPAPNSTRTYHGFLEKIVFYDYRP